MKQVCADCIYLGNQVDDFDGENLFLCRRFPPHYQPHLPDYTCIFWPKVTPDLDWCGEFKSHQQEQCDVSIRVLQLNGRIENCLGWHKISTVGQLLELSKGDLLKMRNLGLGSYNQIMGALDDFKATHNT